MPKPSQGLQSRPVYSRLSYRWQLFGIRIGHLGIAFAPPVIWVAAVAFVSPNLIDGSPEVAMFATIAGAAIIDAFGPMLLPDLPRGVRAGLGALPGLVLAFLAQLPLPMRAALPIWPALPLGCGLLVSMVLWQWRRPPDALSIALRWSVAPRHYHAGIVGPRSRRRAVPVDVSWCFFHPNEVEDAP